MSKHVCHPGEVYHCDSMGTVLTLARCDEKYDRAARFLILTNDGRFWRFSDLCGQIESWADGAFEPGTSQTSFRRIA